MYHQTTFLDSLSAISSVESPGGCLPLSSPDGQQIDLFGPAPVRASRSQRPAKAKVLTTSATSGQSGSISSASADLQSSLVSRLKERLGMVGRTKWLPIWKEKITPSFRLYWAHTASRRTTRDPGSISLPTPSGTSNHGKNHVSGRLDEWGGSSNPFRGMSLGRVHCPAFELWVMGYPDVWLRRTALETPSCRKSPQSSSPPTSTPKDQ